MQDHICQVPSAACQIAKSTGCWRSVVYWPRSGLSATCHHGPSILGTSKTSAAPAFWASARPVIRQNADTRRAKTGLAIISRPPLRRMPLGAAIRNRSADVGLLQALIMHDVVIALPAVGQHRRRQPGQGI